MSQMQPAIALLESEAEGLRARISALDAEAGELRGRLSGLDAAAEVLRRSMAIAPLLLEARPSIETPKVAEPRSTAELFGAVGGVDRVLAAIDDLGPRANISTLGVRLASPPDLVAELLAELERFRRIRIVRLGPRKGEIVRMEAPLPVRPAAEAPPAARPPST